MSERSGAGTGRMAGQVVILTGAAGNIGTHIARRMLGEGAKLVMTGRNEDKLNSFVQQLADEAFDRDAMLPAVGDAADPEACRDVVAAATRRFGRIDALINNAGGAGPKRTLREIPFTEADKEALGDGETMLEAAMNLLGGPWNMTRAAVPHLSVGGSIVNVSTIFSRTPYFGRIPYVVPKSGLNALSLGLARELGAGDRAIRVNTVFPGPIESERIDTVFAAMDGLQEQPPGTTSRRFRSLMTHRRPDTRGELDFRYPKPEDVASTILFLASPEAAAFSGQSFEVTNGMKVSAQSQAKLVSWPDDRLVDLRGRVVLILGGFDVNEALVFAQRNAGRGARVVMAFRSLKAVGHARALVQNDGLSGVRLEHVDPLRRESLDRLFETMREVYGRMDGVIILPNTPNGQHGYALSMAGDLDVRGFVEQEIVAPVAFASALARHLAGWDLRRAPAVTFVTNPDDGFDNRLNEIKRAAVEELIRVWRHEDEHLAQQGQLPWGTLPNQMVRFDNQEPDHLTFAADWTATLNNRVRRMDPINLWLPKQIRRATGKTSMPLSIQRVLPGLHLGRTAVITGGSLGIGVELGRYLALAGARVLLSARGRDQLEEARDGIVADLSAAGYDEPEERVHILDGVDVADEAALQRLYDHSIELFGEVDFLINNAGISGAEEMVVDMTTEAWTRTMDANLVSNYSLIRKFAPGMKRRGHGRILNVSSYFGGEKYVAVAYPNRADYAVSKAGQRILAEILSRHLGPEIQINAVAPGPVDGARLRGLGGAPGLFSRRGRLILDNKRLAQVHATLLECLDGGTAPEELMPLARNRIAELEGWDDAPEPLRRLLGQVGKETAEAAARHFLLHEALARKLLARLVCGGRMVQRHAEAFMEAFQDAPQPFFAPEEVQDAAEKIETSILDLMHLHRMPTDAQVALSTVFSLADDIVSGETFHPSGGLKFDRSVTEGELLLHPGERDLERLRGKHVVLFGDALRRELAAMAQGFARHGVASLGVFLRDEAAAAEVRAQLAEVEGTDLRVEAIGEAIEDTLDATLRERGRIDVVVSTPLAPLPMKPLAADGDGDWDRVLSRDDFAMLVRDQLTHHFRIARRVALYPRCQVVLVTPETSRASTREEFALALFVKNALHAFTVTLGVEAERLPSEPAVNQVQLTRRARGEEPANSRELQEEMERMVAAVLLCSVPAPSPQESRYLSRIFRGNAVTV
jgi:malonyl-CoA reductase / 3-hydroxypropionate dehydrogenase (NADP+)